MLNKDTVMCISVASRPSNFGTTLHNAAYQALGLNYLYKAFGIQDIEGVMRGVRALGIRGCSVSMPFKEKVIPLLDSLDRTAQMIGAVNTIVNDQQRLIGYNTDAYGAKIVLEDLGLDANDRILLLGAGGVAKAILFALKELGFENIILTNRTMEKLDGLEPERRYMRIAWEERNQQSMDMIINATSIGMQPDHHQMPVDEQLIRRCKAVMDVVISPMESLLLQTAKSLGKKIAEGYRMSLHQAAGQFRLYTGKDAPLEVMEKCLFQLLKS
jgi:shikimate dehydrogenase